MGELEAAVEAEVGSYRLGLKNLLFVHEGDAAAGQRRDVRDAVGGGLRPPAERALGVVHQHVDPGPRPVEAARDDALQADAAGARTARLAGPRAAAAVAVTVMQVRRGWRVARHTARVDEGNVAAIDNGSPCPGPDGPNDDEPPRRPTPRLGDAPRAQQEPRQAGSVVGVVRAGPLAGIRRTFPATTERAPGLRARINASEPGRREKAPGRATIGFPVRRFQAI
ncbi:MAG: hypothetical protein MUF34_28050 [Polyangiaceae bacterium]|nr:hypothetical protein [Polyangiaceae bacterium]